MKRLLGKAALTIAVGGGILAIGGSGYADCVCQHCCGDPVFVQRDLRQRKRLHQLRQAKARKMKRLSASKKITKKQPS